jgi:micrococcal nuclease
MLRFAPIAAALLLAFLVAPATPAQAAVCADYPNQAAAQLTKDTYDGDNDGIFCEAIPCPCSPEWHAQHDEPVTQPVEPSRPSNGKTRVYNGRIIRVVDGDTLKVKVKRRTKTVRVIGIDTPESKKPNTPVQCGAKEATSHAIRWSFSRRYDRNHDGLYESGARGRKVKLRTDPTQTLTDKYGRTLAYVGRGKLDFGKSQVAAGWVEFFVWESNPFMRLASYQSALDRAREGGRGAWSLCDGNFHSDS